MPPMIPQGAEELSEGSWKKDFQTLYEGRVIAL
jgi:hypothetical protein